MKKSYPTSVHEWAKHLRRIGKRLANRSTRRIFKRMDNKEFKIEHP